MRERRVRFKEFSARAAALLTCMVCVLCAACGNGAAATTMKLARVEGEVSVRDEKEKDLTPAEDMNLYSGYQLKTGKESYSYINLDSVKLTKMDEESDVEIQKSGKDLEILLHSGSLFFNVTEPLKEDETMSIRTSNMAVGIRGTCGWVDVPGEGEMYVYILEGTVECSITDPDTGEVAAAQTVTEGESARLVWKDGKAEIIVEKFTKEEIPFFVTAELEKDSGLEEQVGEILAANQEASGNGAEDGEGVSGEDGSGEGASGEDGNAVQEPVVITTNVNELEFVNGNGTGNVIVTLRDGMYGAMNLNGEEIVPNKYSTYVRTPNKEGQFALGDGENTFVFDNQGNMVVEIPGLISLQISENAATYSRTNAEGRKEVGCYDMGEGRMTLKMELTDEQWQSNFSAQITGMQNGSFYCSSPGDLRLRQIQKDGSTVWTDEALEAEMERIWEEEEQSQGEQMPDRDWANVGGMSSFMYDPGYPVQSPNGGYMVCAPWLEASIFRMFDCNERRYLRFDTYRLEEGFVWNQFEEMWPQSFYDDGQWYANKGTQVVMRGFVTYGGEDHTDYLVDFSKARTDELGNVLNLSDLILAEYPYISLAGDGYYAASDGESWFYLNEQGSMVNSARWTDCSGFYDGYALVVEEDGMAYVVDKNFDKVTEGYPADSVSRSGGMLCVRKGDEQTFIYIR